MCAADTSISWRPANLLFWAKLPSQQPGAAYYPLPCHMIDVAKAALAIWEDVVSRAARRDAARDLGIGEDVAGRWIAFWAGLHDIGKASPAFQLKDDSARHRLSKAGLPCPLHLPDGRHGAITVAVSLQMLTSRGVSRWSNGRGRHGGGVATMACCLGNSPVSYRA